RVSPLLPLVRATRSLLARAAQAGRRLGPLAGGAHTLPIVELVYLVESRPDTEPAILFRVLHKGTALAVFESLLAPHQAELISGLRTRQVADIIGELDPDDRASLFDELPASVAEQIGRAHV